jgi:hypothetical protein
VGRFIVSILTNWFSGAVPVNTYDVYELEEPKCGCVLPEFMGANMFLALPSNASVSYQFGFQLFPRSTNVNTFSSVVDLGRYRRGYLASKMGDYVHMGYNITTYNAERIYPPDNTQNISYYVEDAEYRVLTPLSEDEFISEEWIAPDYTHYGIFRNHWVQDPPVEPIKLLELPWDDSDITGEYWYRQWTPIIVGDRLLRYQDGFVASSPYNGCYQYHIVDINTGEQLFHDKGYFGDPQTGNQFPVNPPVVVNEKVYILTHTYYQGYEVGGVITEIDICTGTHRLMRLHYNGFSADPFCGHYNPSDGNIYFIFVTREGDPWQYQASGLAKLNLPGFTWDIIYVDEELYDTCHLLRSHNNIYVLKGDGAVVAIDDLDTVLTYIPDGAPEDIVSGTWVALNVDPGPPGFTQLSKICPTITDDNRIWVLHNGYLKGRSLTGEATIQYDASTIPTPSINTLQQIFLSDGHIFVKNNEGSTTLQHLYMFTSEAPP